MKKFLICTLFVFSIQFSIAQNVSRHLQIYMSGTLSIKNPEELGILHNQALEYVLSNVRLEKGMTPQYFFKQYNELMSQFFYKRGLQVQFLFSGDYIALEQEINTSICFQTQQLSEEAKSFACSIDQSFQDLSTMRMSVEQFLLRMDELISLANKLESEHEQMLCGLTAAVAKHSVTFWSKNYERFALLFDNIFTKEEEIKRGPSIQIQEMSFAPLQKIRWWSVAASDVYGAWNWGRFGTAAGGGVGIASLGIAGAAWHSGASIVTQATIKTLK